MRPRQHQPHLHRQLPNYPKGPEFGAIFDVLGDCIFTSDGDSWATQRKAVHEHMVEEKFRQFVAEMSKGKVERALLPMLARVTELGQEMDLQWKVKCYINTGVCTEPKLFGWGVLIHEVCSANRGVQIAPPAEYKPERWITKRGAVRFEPTYRYLVFKCSMRAEDLFGERHDDGANKEGRGELDLQLHGRGSGGARVEPRTAMVLHMKNGFLAKMRKRERGC
ncbi:hypothetical protein QJS10_CPA07g00403 [Acorus calamus]|uniref:Cytochrome P450 n=1 Tax=Acorus calamus TaxID=4465 RepID=A0AAV9EDA5_ACOCL|nr:hypothetical protein QJS10_CPA07g00403 [Acorus calamus]